jgi:hypothetical protein
MISLFKYPKELTPNELTQLYSIHNKVYCSKGIGLEYEVWENHLFKQYHNVTDKIVQLFYFQNEEIVDAYNILLVPVTIEGKRWSKIIEGGSAPKSRKDIKNAFLMMYQDLLFWQRDIVFWGESGVSYHAVTNLLIESGFVLNYDLSKLQSVVEIFIQSKEFELGNNDSKVEIKRKTFITPTYHGYILVNDYRQSNDNINI